MNTTAILNQPGWAHDRLIWRISLTPIHLLGIITAIYRICRRYKMRRSGLDDYTATFVLILDLIFFPTLWLSTGAPDISQAATEDSGSWSGDGLGGNIESRNVQLAMSWLVQILYPLLTWSAKTSLALTIARLIPPSQPTRKASIIVAYLSTFLGIGILIQSCIFCSKLDQTWTHELPYRCPVTDIGGSIRLCSEVVVDICLVLIPSCTFFWPLRLPNYLTLNLRNNNNNNNNPSPPVRLRLPLTTCRLIQACFAASLLTASTAAIFVTVILAMARSDSPEIRSRVKYFALVLSHLTASVSLLACNMLIVVTSLYQIMRTQPDVVEVGKSPIVPDLPEPTTELGNATASSEERAVAARNQSENSSSLMNGGGGASGGTGGGTGGGHSTNLTRTSTGTSYHPTFTELFESDLSNFQIQRIDTDTE